MSFFSSLDPKKLRKNVYSALKAFHQADGTPENLLEVLLLVKEGRKEVNKGTSIRAATNQLLLTAIDELGCQDETLAETLKLRFVQRQTGLETALTLNLSLDQVNRRQREAISSLTHYLWQQEIAFRQARSREMALVLPQATYTRLFGLDGAQARLVQALHTPKDPWLVAIVGVGGIGKTALADAVTRQVIEHFCFEQILWLQVGQAYMGWGQQVPDLTLDNLMAALAKQLSLPTLPSSERMQQVTQVLKAAPYLIVIDNLEIETDTTYLLAHIARWAQPSKFLVTTRTLPPPEMAVFSFSLGELTVEDTMALLRHYGELSGVSHLIQASAKNLASIYAVTGGNPLAIKLVAGLVSRRLPLAQILANLEHNPLGSGESLYQRIYWKTWHTLDAPAQTLLQAMLLASEIGVPLEPLQAMSGLAEKEMWSAMTSLTARSLLETRGTLEQPRYAIHRLTDSFLRTEIIHLASEKTEVPPFMAQVQANLVYWQAHVEAAWPDEERPNLIRAIQFGLQYPPTRLQAVAVTRQSFLFVERQGGWREWIALLEQVVAGWQQEPVVLKGVLLNQLGHLYRLNRQLTAALEVHRQSEAIAREAKDRVALAHAWFQLCADYYEMRQYDRALTMGGQALQAFQQGDDSAAQIAATRNQLGLAARASGDLETAKEHLAAAAQRWESLAEPTEWARSLQNLAIVLAETGQTKAAQAHYEQARQLLAQTNPTVDMARLLLSLGALYYNEQAWAAARAAFEEAQRYLGDRPSYIYLQALVANNLGSVLREQQHLVEAASQFQEAVKLWRQADEAVSLANALGGQGQTLAALEQYREAQACYEEALSLLAQAPGDARAQRFYKEIYVLREALDGYL